MNNLLAKVAPLAALTLLFTSAAQAQHEIPADSAIDAQSTQTMARTQSNGLAIGVINHGKVSHVRAYGIRNAKREPLTTDTVMYGASLTKMVFTFT
jgi:CubicO group peptidase (beta-lactamase class C family)